MSNLRPEPVRKVPQFTEQMMLDKAIKEGIPREEAIQRIIAARPKKKPQVRNHRKIGRNEPCPCGSELKYKKCHGK